MANYKSLFLCFLFLFRVLPLPSKAHLLKACKFDAIYQFGDSISDAGNLIQQRTSSFYSRLPYGQDFFFHKPTGRCSNGLIIIDFIALSAGLPLLDPYLNPNATASTRRHGFNFAVAGSTALPFEVPAQSAFRPDTNTSLTTQLEWMSTLFNNLSKEDSDHKFNNSLFMVGEIGGNDYNYPLLFQGKTLDEVKSSLVPKVVEAIKIAVSKIISYGGTKIVVPGNFPIGCLPVYLTGFHTNDSTAYDEFHCLKELNNFSIYHNEQLKQAIKELQNERQNVSIVYGDYYNAYMWILEKASLLGFDTNSLQKACCGKGGDYDFNQTKMCGNVDVPVCPKPQERLSWDGIHSTQKTYFYMARWLIRDIFTKLRCYA